MDGHSYQVIWSTQTLHWSPAWSFSLLPLLLLCWWNLPPSDTTAVHPTCFILKSRSCSLLGQPADIPFGHFSEPCGNHGLSFYSHIRHTQVSFTPLEGFCHFYPHGLLSCCLLSFQVWSTVSCSRSTSEHNSTSANDPKSSCTTFFQSSQVLLHRPFASLPSLTSSSCMKTLILAHTLKNRLAPSYPKALFTPYTAPSSLRSYSTVQPAPPGLRVQSTGYRVQPGYIVWTVQTSNNVQRCTSSWNT